MKTMKSFTHVTWFILLLTLSGCTNVPSAVLNGDFRPPLAVEDILRIRVIGVVRVYGQEIEGLLVDVQLYLGVHVVVIVTVGDREVVEIGDVSLVRSYFSILQGQVDPGSVYLVRGGLICAVGGLEPERVHTDGVERCEEVVGLPVRGV